MGGLAMATTELSSLSRRVWVPVARDDLRAWRGTCRLMLLITLATGVTVCVVPDARTLARELLRLTLSANHNPPPSLLLVVSIAANNALHSVWPCTLGLLDAQRRRVSRLIADACVLANLAVPAVLVGSALAAYGTRTLPYIPNVPVEFVGIAAGATGWLVERDRPLTKRERAGWIGLSIVLLLCAATIETYLVPHR
jgi:hypothetical protein